MIKKYIKLDVIYFGVDAAEKTEKPKDEPPADPSIAKIASNKESIIEINANNKGLGLFVAGGKMLTPPVVCIIFSFLLYISDPFHLVNTNKTTMNITGRCLYSVYLSKRCCQS